MLARTPPQTARGGFTLTEMLVVVAIIVILAGIAVPITLNVLSESKEDIARSHIESTLMGAAKRYQARPTNPPLESLEQLLERNGGSLTDKALMDPWGHEYQIQFESEDRLQFVIYTTTPSGKRIAINTQGDYVGN